MNTNRIWDFWAGRYDRLWIQRVILEPSRRLVHERLDRPGFHPARLLDVGCGIGQFAMEAAARYPDCAVMACDSSLRMLERARASAGASRVSFRHGTLAAVRHEPGFDAVVCMHAFPYFPDPPGTMLGLAALLRPGGRLFVINANTDTLYDRLVLRGLKCLVSRATYPSSVEVGRLMSGAGLRPEPPVRLATPAWIPSVHLVEAAK